MRRFVAALAIAVAALTAGVVATPHASATACPKGSVSTGHIQIGGTVYEICVHMPSLSAFLVPIG